MEHIFQHRPHLSTVIRTGITNATKQWNADLDLELVDDMTDAIIRAMTRNYTSARIGHTECIIVPTKPRLAPTEEEYGVAA